MIRISYTIGRFSPGRDMERCSGRNRPGSAGTAFRHTKQATRIAGRSSILQRSKAIGGKAEIQSAAGGTTISVVIGD